MLASADVGKTWYWFPERIPVSTFVYSVAIWSVYSAWVVIGGFIGWFRLRLSERQLRPAVEWSLHGIASVTVGLVHLAANAGLVWLMYSPSVPNLSATTIYLEKLIAWLPFEILAYWGCLAVFTLLAQRRDSLQVADAPAYQQRLSARSGDETVVVHCSDIDWIEAMDNYVLVHARGHRHVVRDTMSRLEKALDPAMFQRIHRSAIVNLRRIDRLQPADSGGLHVRMKAGQTLPVSRRRRAALRSVVAGQR